MKPILPLLAAVVALPALAAPATYLKGAPDAQGISHYWVKCENGNVSTVQCLKDEMHCGAARNEPLPREAIKACDSIMGLTMGTGK